MDSFGVERVDKQSCAVLEVRGEVDLTAAPRLRHALVAIVAEGHDHVVVDLTDTEFLDSTGLGALVAGLKRIRARGGEMRVVCSNPRVCKVFEITSLDRVVPMFETVEEACAFS